jgi:Papain family cysteine protease
MSRYLPPVIIATVSLICAEHCNAEEQKANILAAQQRITPKEGEVISSNGTPYYRTADGVLRRLTPVSKIDLQKVAPPAKLQPMALPARVMLDELGLETSAKDQAGRGTCTLFASVGAIESEYLAQYGLSLNLSEEYLHNMINETRPIDWDGGVPTEKLYNASYYGLPPTQSYPYIPDINTLLSYESTIIPFLPRSDYSELFSTNVVMVPRDLVNYSPLTYPAASVHAQATYGPLPGALASIPDPTNGDLTLFETIIAQHHSVVFMTATGAWSQNPQTGVYEYNPNGDQTTNHAILLVGYDLDKQIVRIKNSWGQSFGNSGFADFTYELFLKTATGAVYVTGIRDPQQAAGGSAIWRGFWRGSLNGVSGVAAVYHTYQPDGSGNTSVVEDAAAFFGDDGSSVLFPNVSAATLSAVIFSGSGVKVTLQQGVDGTATARESPSGKTATWYRCGATPGQYNIDPLTDAAVVDDPYVLPPCNGVTLPCCQSLNQANCIPVSKVVTAATTCPAGYSEVITGPLSCSGIVSPTPYCANVCIGNAICISQPELPGGPGCVPGKPCRVQ